MGFEPATRSFAPKYNGQEFKTDTQHLPAYVKTASSALSTDGTDDRHQRKIVAAKTLTLAKTSAAKTLTWRKRPKQEGERPEHRLNTVKVSLAQRAATSYSGPLLARQAILLRPFKRKS
jgi:hypothetical protein